MTPMQLQALDFIRERLAGTGFSPTQAEIGAEIGAPGRVADVLTALERQGKVRRERGKTRNIRIVEAPDLQLVPTDALRAELARRGVTLEALAEHPAPIVNGMPCAFEPCGELVGRGKLFCRNHWWAISAPVRERILRAYRRKDVDAYSLAIEEARAELETIRSEAA